MRSVRKAPFFAEGGAIKLGQLKQIPLLGHIPFEPIIMQAADEGTPGILKEGNRSLQKRTKHSPTNCVTSSTLKQAETTAL